MQVFIIESRQLDYRVLHQHERTNQSETTKRKENASLPICNSKFLCTQRTMTKTQTSSLNERFSFPSWWANASKLRHSSVFLKGPWWKSKNALKIINNTYMLIRLCLCVKYDQFIKNILESRHIHVKENYREDKEQTQEEKAIRPQSGKWWQISLQSSTSETKKEFHKIFCYWSSNNNCL